MTTGVIIVGSVAGAFLLGLLLVWILRRVGAITSPVIYQAAMVALGTIICMLLVVLVSLSCQLNHFVLILYAAMMLALVGFYLYSLVMATSTRRAGQVPDIVRQFWSVQKAFGGGVFGDFANSVGILSGLGAYQLSNAGEGWFWLAQFAAFLAALVGLSLGMRWILEASSILEGAPKWTRWYALLNFAVGAFTFLSITSPTESASLDTVNLLRHLLLKVPQTVVLALMVINLLFFIWWFWINRDDTHRYHALYLPWILMFLLAGGAIAALWIFQNTKTPNWLPAFFGCGAILSWVVIEFLSAIQNRGELVKVLRSGSIILGNLAMLYLVIWVAVENPSTYGGVHWFLFSEAILLTILATLVGIILAARVVARRHLVDAVVPVGGGDGGGGNGAGGDGNGAVEMQPQASASESELSEGDFVEIPL